jgi:hypothetical protein
MRCTRALHPRWQLDSHRMGCGAVRTGSVLLNTTLPEAVFTVLKQRLDAADPEMISLFIDKLMKLGLIAIGDVYERRPSKRITFLPDVLEEKRADVQPKMVAMMEDLIEQQDGEPTPERTDLTLYFDAEELEVRCRLATGLAHRLTACLHASCDRRVGAR